jgi:hypothetical protein
MKYESDLYDKALFPIIKETTTCSRELGLSVAKYKNIRYFSKKDNQVFDSVHEYMRFKILKNLVARKHITGLETQIEFLVSGKKGKKRKYIADFTYYLKGYYIIEDVKHPKLMKSFRYAEMRKQLCKEYSAIIVLVHPKKIFCRPESILKNFGFCIT